MVATAKNAPAPERMATTKRTVRLGDLCLVVDDFRPNPRFFTGMAPAEIAELGDSVEEHLINPLLVQRVEDGDGEVHELVLDGQRRYLSLRHIGASADLEVPVVDYYDRVLKLTDEVRGDLIEAALEAFAFREPLSTYELIQAAEQLRVLGRPLAEIGRKIRKSESWVSRALKAWRQATPELKESLKQGKITDEQFRELADVKDPNAQREAAADIITIRERGQKGAAASVAREVAEKARKKQAFPEQPAPRGPDPWLDIDDDGPPTPESDAAADAADAKRKRLAANGKAGAAVRAATRSHEEQKRAAKNAARIERPSHGRIGDFAKLRNERKGAKHAYVRGMVDMAAFVNGDITEDELGAPWKDYVKQLHKGKKRK